MLLEQYDPERDLLLVALVCNPEPGTWSPHRSPIAMRVLNCDPALTLSGCNEVTYYLRFIIRVYEMPLAKKYIFVHGHDRAWHYGNYTHPGEFWPLLNALLTSRYLRNNSFGGVAAGECGKDCGLRQGAWNDSEDEWVPGLYRYFFANTSMPPSPQLDSSWYCCATFFVSQELLWRRPRTEWELLLRRVDRSAEDCAELKHLVATEDPDMGSRWWCGRVYEYNWHILLSGRTHTPPLAYD